jgi:hypothetical protein
MALKLISRLMVSRCPIRRVLSVVLAFFAETKSRFSPRLAAEPFLDVYRTPFLQCLHQFGWRFPC